MPQQLGEIMGQPDEQAHDSQVIQIEEDHRLAEIKEGKLVCKNR